MKIEDILESALGIAEQVSPDLIQTIEQLRATADKDSLKVAVIGDFKAGKSTLLNRLFLNTAYLPTDTLSATAVPTYLSAGAPELNVWSRNEHGEETIIRTTQQFGADDVRAVVTASTKEARAALAKSCCKVSVSLPGILPAGITVVDTPGLNDSDPDIYCNTLLEARRADAIIYVVHDKQLGERECCLIADLVGSQHHKIPVHVVFTLDSPSSKPAAQVQRICSEIVSALALQGLNSGISVFYFNEDRGDLMDDIDCAPVKSDSVFDDWDSLDVFGAATKSETQPSSEEKPTGNGDTVGGAKESITAFLSGPAGAGRNARLCREMVGVLQKLKMAIESRIQVAGVDADKLEQLKAQLQAKKQEFNRVVASMLQDVRGVQTAYINSIENELDDIQTYYKDMLNGLTSASQVLSCIAEWQKDIPVRIHRKMKMCNSQLQQGMNALTLKYNAEFEAVSPEKVCVDLESGVLAKVAKNIPGWLIVTADYMLCEVLSPLPFVIDIPLRMILSKIPMINALLPSNLLADAARNNAIQQLSKSVDAIKTQVEAQLENRFIEMNKKCAVALCDNGVYAEYERAIAEIEQNALTPDDIEKLKQQLVLINQWGLNL